MRPAPATKVRPRDVLLASRIVRQDRTAAGVALRIILEARAHGLLVSELLACLTQETGIQNIFGHDIALFAGQKVTEQRVRQLVGHVLAGGVSNGVGDGQLTYIGFIQEANRDGGAWVRRVNIATTAGILGNLKRRHGIGTAYEIYNAGHVGTTAGVTYRRHALYWRSWWHDRIA